MPWAIVNGEIQLLVRDPNRVSLKEPDQASPEQSAMLDRPKAPAEKQAAVSANPRQLAGFS
jgi:hypothetical protein